MPRSSTSFGPQVTSFDYRTTSGLVAKTPLVSSAAEPVTIDGSTVAGTAPTATVNFYVNAQSVLYLTSNAGANWTLNFAGTAATPMNLFLNTGQSVTAVLLATQGSTAYYASTIQVDGTTVTPKWQGGSAPTAGNASGVDSYAFTIIKTGNAAFTVLASQTQFT